MAYRVKSFSSYSLEVLSSEIQTMLDSDPRARVVQFGHSATRGQYTTTYTAVLVLYILDEDDH